MVSVRSGGGGGWGNPLERDPALVARDAKNELISAEDAKRDYGVILEATTLEVDTTATERERASAASHKSLG